MPTAAEHVCCQDFVEILPKLQEYEEQQNLREPPDYTTQHLGFEQNCLSVYVLERDLARMRQDGEDEEELIHQYRHIVYRNLVTWIWRVVGRKRRIILPACVVTKIRQAFPAENSEYCGFKYPQPLSLKKL